jgi:hypothetical protein
MIILFTLIDYAAFAIWIPLSMFLSYILVKKFRLFGGEIKSQKILTIGLILGHLLYLLWKSLWLYFLDTFQNYGDFWL